jgi:hypothetical protein
MTAEEILDNQKHGFGSGQFESALKAMQEYAKLKCQELLLLVAEKAVIKTEKKSQFGKSRKWQKVKDGEDFDLFAYEMRNSVDKGSIFKAVDLDEFIN